MSTCSVEGCGAFSYGGPCPTHRYRLAERCTLESPWKECPIPGCYHIYNSYLGHGMCSVCWQTEKRRKGNPRERRTQGRRNETLLERIFRQIGVDKESESECWSWSGSFTNSTAMVAHGGKQFGVRRVLYEHCKGPWPKQRFRPPMGCENPEWCVNPDHVYDEHMDALMRATIYMADGQMYLEWPEDYDPPDKPQADCIWT